MPERALAYFISDLHLGARYRGIPAERETCLLRFLRVVEILWSIIFMFFVVLEFLL